jgi:hypothetical protein
LPGSTATGAQSVKRFTNLMRLTVDTSWWLRYRSPNQNPDFGDTFQPIIPGLAMGQFPAIPRSDADLKPAAHIQAIANTMIFVPLTAGNPAYANGCIGVYQVK